MTVGGDLLPLAPVTANYTAGGAGAVYSVPCTVTVPPGGLPTTGMTMTCGPTPPGAGKGLFWSFFYGGAAIPVSGAVSPTASCEGEGEEERGFGHVWRCKSRAHRHLPSPAAAAAACAAADQAPSVSGVVAAPQYNPGTLASALSPAGGEYLLVTGTSVRERFTGSSVLIGSPAHMPSPAAAAFSWALPLCPPPSCQPSSRASALWTAPRPSPTPPPSSRRPTRRPSSCSRSPGSGRASPSASLWQARRAARLAP